MLSSLPLTLLIASAIAAESTSPKQHNTNHIFNAIHSSLRQWGSSLNHNGMSFFLATVPVDVSLYHGTGKDKVVKGMEWLAFEPEHAIMFARAMVLQNDRGISRPFDAREEKEELWKNVMEKRRPRHPDQKPFLNDEYDLALDSGNLALDSSNTYPGGPSNGTGYLHTYKTKQPLHLVYIDGQSAGKTKNGTLDTQDILLFNRSIPAGGLMYRDSQRARKICEMSKTVWGEKVDGVLRMEAGFEIILCKFEKKLELVDMMAVPGIELIATGILGRRWEYIRAVASRYHGLGETRATLDYEDFVSVFEFDTEERGLDLWVNNVQSDTPHPRLQNAKSGQLEDIKNAIAEMVLRSGEKKSEGRNWQSVTDSIVKRYSKPLHHLHTDTMVRSSKMRFYEYLDTIVVIFIAPAARNGTLEMARCLRQFVPTLPATPSLAHSTVHAVTTRICQDIIVAYDMTSTSLTSSHTHLPPSSAIRIIDELVGWLQWTSWKECGPCSDEEVCFVPIWPMGSHQQHKTPKCVTEEGVENGYWGIVRGAPTLGVRPPDSRPPGIGRP